MQGGKNSFHLSLLVKTLAKIVEPYIQEKMIKKSTNF